MLSTTHQTPYRASPRPRIRYGARKNEMHSPAANAAQLVMAPMTSERLARADDTGAASGVEKLPRSSGMREEQIDSVVFLRDLLPHLRIHIPIATA